MLINTFFPKLAMPSIFTYLSNRLCDHFFTLSNFIISRKEESVTFSKVSSALGHRCRRHDTLIGVQLAAKMTAFLAFGKAFSNLINNLTALIATVSSSLLDHFIAHFVRQSLAISLNLKNISQEFMKEKTKMHL